MPEADVAEERAIYERLPEVESKPEEVREKIVEGMLAKRFFAQTVLLDQPWVHDPSLTVGQALAEHGAEVRGLRALQRRPRVSRKEATSASRKRRGGAAFERVL